MDGDLQHNPKYILKLLNKINHDNSDIVIASRNFDKTSASSLSFIRNAFSRILILILRVLSGKSYVDPMSGYFIFKKKFLLKIKKFFMERAIKY